MQRVKAAIAEIAVTVEETEREYARLGKRARGVPEQADVVPEQARRVHDKLRDEWAALQAALQQRHDRCSFLYAAA